MKRYQYNPIELSRIEKSNVPMAVYQFLDNRVATIALSQGFLDLLGYTDRQAAYQLMEQNMYQDIHPDDIAIFRLEIYSSPMGARPSRTLSFASS